MSDHTSHFKGKKITVMGLGLLGRSVGDIAFLADYGAELVVTDLKNEEELEASLQKLKKYKGITYHLGGHYKEDFQERDMILKSAGVPLDSPYIKEAENHGIPIEMSSALFTRLAPCTTIGITGTRGKSTVTHLLYEILKADGRDVRLGGNVKGVSTLAQLPDVKEETIMVMELDSWQLQGFAYAKISPDIAIFTNLLPDHMNYYKGDMAQYLSDKKNIFRYHDERNLLVIGEAVGKILESDLASYKGEKIVARAEDVPLDWSPQLIGVHNRENIAHALAVARYLGISPERTKEVVERFDGVPGRLQNIREVRGVSFYNDTTATTPIATQAALHALDDGSKRTILIMGGADKSLDMEALISELDSHCKGVVLLPGTGTDKLKLGSLTLHPHKVSSLKEAVEKAFSLAEEGDRVLFSPAFASFGMFKNEFDRGEQFDEIVARL